MVIVPRGNPVFENLNSYYLDLHRLLEHFQGEMGSGAVYLKSPGAEGALFFDAHELLGGSYENRTEKLVGKAAIERLLTPSAPENFQVSIYDIEPEEASYWSSIPNAKRIYNNLSTEFTDLEGLIKKMISEKLSGYIEIVLKSETDGGYLFFRNGQGVGAYFFSEKKFSVFKESQDLILRKAKQSGATFHVSRISMDRREAGKAAKAGPDPEILAALEEILVQLENLFSSNQNLKGGFNTLLKKSFLRLADEYAFLDPFAGEFEFSGRKIRFSGEAKEADLVKGIFLAVKSLAQDHGLSEDLNSRIGVWVKKYQRRLVPLGISAESLLSAR